jgi:hypothetical protein
MLGTDDLYEAPLPVVRRMREYVDRWRERYTGMYNWVARDNMMGMRLLQVLGFRFTDADGAAQVQTYGGLDFIRFQWGDV